MKSNHSEVRIVFPLFMFLMLCPILCAACAAIEQQEFDSLYDAYLQKYHLVLEYKNAVYHLYHSKNRDMILRYLYDITEDFVEKYVRNEVRGHHLNFSRLRPISCQGDGQSAAI